MNDKREYIEAVEEELEIWHDDIYKFRLIAEEAGWKEPDRQIKYYQIIEDIVAQKQDITERLSALEDLDETDWQANKNSIDNLRKEVAVAIITARATIT